MSKTKEIVNVIYFCQGVFSAAKKGFFMKGKSCLNIFGVILEFLKHASLGEISGTQLIYYIKEKVKEWFHHNLLRESIY